VTHHDSDGPLRETANETRQGPKGTPVLKVLIAGLVLAGLAFIYLMTTSVENPPGPGPAGPTSDAVPNNAEPSRLDAPPANPTEGRQ
jgi:hypothetical protein